MVIETIEEKLSKLDFAKVNGLIPTVIMDIQGNLLVLVYSDKESLRMSLETGSTHYWSRTEKRVLQKQGAEIAQIRYNCSNDALQFVVRQKEMACHTGSYSCFHKSLDERG
jgi:phosphoribosyl-AMP cyclohydrolase